MSVWTVRKGGLNTSLPRCVHPPPIKLVFYERPRRLATAAFQIHLGLAEEPPDWVLERETAAAQGA